VDDQRSLGICVSRLQLDGADVALEDEAAFALGSHALEGDSEGHHWRWSHDRTPLPAGTRLIVIDIRGPGYYGQSAAVLSSPCLAERRSLEPRRILCPGSEES